MKRKPKKSDKREVKLIPDTPENVAKALLVLKLEAIGRRLVVRCKLIRKGVNVCRKTKGSLIVRL